MAYTSVLERPVPNIVASPSVEKPRMLGESPALQTLLRMLERAARSSLTVLINGETGTGKELAARSLHDQSTRAHKPFIALNMAAIPRDLLESELFGHERGAFTGAHSRRSGRFEQADGGSLFLDEIGDMPLELQTRLLRVLVDGEFYPVGACAPKQVNVRVITATHQNLEDRVADGRFREDLFHRLNVIRIHTPALRERRDDIPLLLQHYLRQASQELAEAPKQLQPEVENYLCAYHWPGNIRQLENLCHYLSLMTPGPSIRLLDLPTEFLNLQTSKELLEWQDALAQWAVLQLKAGKNNIAKDAASACEKILIHTALELSNGQRNLAAKRLGLGRNTLTRKIQELELVTA